LSRPVLSVQDRSATLTDEQRERLRWAMHILESARISEDGTLHAKMPGAAGDVGAVQALDLYHRLRTFSPSLEPGSLGGAIDVPRFQQVLTEDEILPPGASSIPGRSVSVLLETPGTFDLRFDPQRALVRCLGGDVAHPIEQALAVLVAKCLARRRRPFNAMLRGSKRGLALVDTDLYGLRTMTDSGDAIRGVVMSTSYRAACPHTRRDVPGVQSAWRSPRCHGRNPQNPSIRHGSGPRGPLGLRQLHPNRSSA